MNHAPATPLAELRPALLAWFDANGRDLPWRRRRDPYALWVSEVMLQQTRAASAEPYFERWMERFPTVRALAEADQEKVLKAWEGLGYYRRARNLHRAAQALAATDGELPRREADWRALPGVGPYTAAALAALTGGARTVAVDGNVRRVGHRLLAEAHAADDRIREALLPLVPSERPGRGVEALIELGARICTPRAPACHACPLRPGCAAARAGTPEAFPAARPSRRAPRRRRYARVHRDAGRVWLVRRPQDGLLAGLWGFPQTDRRPAGTALEPVRHVYTHLRLDLVPVLCRATPRDRDGAWFDAAGLRDAALSRVDRKVLDRLSATPSMPETAVGSAP